MQIQNYCNPQIIIEYVYEVLSGSSHNLKSKNQAFTQQSQPLTENIPFKEGELNYLVLGAHGTGKSSLLNHLFKTNEPVGRREEQEEAKSVARLLNKIVLWQTPANTEIFEILTDLIRIFQNAQRIFLLYDGSIQSHQLIIKLTNKLKPKRCRLYLIRTKIDTLKQTQCTAEEEMMIDRTTLQDWEVEPTEHLSISIKEPYNQYHLALLKVLMATP